MPTGTGKTETMLAVLVSTPCPKLLIVVPTDALRSQLAEKFLTLGVLRPPHSAVLSETARSPIVCSLKHIPRTEKEVDDVFTHAQVVVATSSIVGQCPAPIQERIAEHCEYLFIDEAHHVEAKTWSAFREKFRSRRILQFTATPFREDGRALEGEIIFKYSLKLAQEAGYFTAIDFKRVRAFNQALADRAISELALAQLRTDFDRGHIVMARVESVARAKEVFELYRPFPEFKPIQLHTGIKSPKAREQARRQLLTGESRIVVCVDMLGEGFDLPELKIAAFHDIKKSLAVTLQLAGRFTRVHPKLGHATFIANTADVDVRDALRQLYARDPDWNVLLPQLSDQMIAEQQSLKAFLQGFGEFADEIPLQTVKPATSAVVYRTNCQKWTPEDFRDGIPGIDECERVLHALNPAERTLIVVTARRKRLEWTDVESLTGWDWELYVLVWWAEKSLLFINSSTKSGVYRALAQAVAGEGVSLISGQEVFRVFSGVNRLRLQNVGLSEYVGRSVSYTGKMGADVGRGISEQGRGKTQKSVLSGGGYENGDRVTYGASRRGRIWSHQRDGIDKLVTWCKAVGAKVVDHTINPDDVLAGTLVAETVALRPEVMPIRIDWPEEIYRTPEGIWVLTIDGKDFGLAALELQLIEPSPDGPLRLAVVSENASAELELELVRIDGIANYRFVARGGSVAIRRTKSLPKTLEEFFYDCPPIVWFADGSSLEGNQLVKLKSTIGAFDRARIDPWDWAGVDLRVESQGSEKRPDSIQATVIRALLRRDYTMIVDDDGKGEAADIVAVRVVGEATAPEIVVEFYHCKYAQGGTVGRRVEDLYEVCGQAQKSILWAIPEKQSDLFTHLMRREELRQISGGASRYELGDKDTLESIREMSRICPVSLKIFAVQPAVSRSRASDAQQMLLGGTENYLFETYQVPFAVIGSA